MMMPLSFLRWSLYRQYLWANALGLSGVAQTIYAVFQAFEDADTYGGEVLGILQSILVEIAYECPRDRLSRLWLRWTLARALHWHIVAEPEHTPYIQFKRISRQLGQLIQVYRLLPLTANHLVEQQMYRYAALLLAHIPSTDRWIYERMRHAEVEADFWTDLISVTFPLPPEVTDFLTHGEESALYQDATPAPLGGRNISQLFPNLKPVH